MSQRKVEVSSEQVADVARELAASFGHHPETVVAHGPPALVGAQPYTGTQLFLAPRQEHVFPIWRLYEHAAQRMLGKIGELAGVELIVVSDNEQHPAP